MRLYRAYLAALLCGLSAWAQAPHKLAIASKFRNEAPFLREWIEYHRLMGVGHFWLYNDRSTDDWELILSPYVEKGIVDVFNWPKPVEEENHCYSQVRAYQDALCRALGIAEWVALIDIDEFLVPMRDDTVTACLDRHFSEASAIYANWRMFGTGGRYVPFYTPFLTSLLSCSLASHSENCIGKTIVRPECAIVETMWYVHHVQLKPGSAYFTGDGVAMKCESGVDICTDGHHHGRFLRINHYYFRDENFFQKVRLPDPRKPFGLKMEHYDAFSTQRDSRIVALIKKNPQAYQKIWRISEFFPELWVEDLNDHNVWPR
ncbi:MAG: glycosyltransferase family 92 protein [Chlamydiia bacterium]